MVCGRWTTRERHSAMSDRTAMEVEIFGMGTPAAREAVLEALCSMGMVEHVSEIPAEELDAGALGEHLRAYDTEAELCAWEDLATALVAVPGIIFCIHQDGKYEYDGQVFMYAPDLGRYGSVGSNADGAPLVFASDIDKVLASVRGLVAEDSRDPELLSTLRGVVEALDGLSGRAHRERIEALRAARTQPANG